MTSDPRRRRIVRAACAGLLLGLGVACSDALAPLSGGPRPAITAAATGMRSVRVEWPAAEDAVGYRLERRAGLRGPFAAVAEVPAEAASGGVVRWFDNALDPDTDYGYRIRVITRLDGDRAPSTVAGARTSPWPGIEVVASTSAASPESGDADGYTVRVEGPDTAQAAVAPSGRVRLTPLKPGTYTVRLDGMRANCAPTGQDASVRRQAVVSDTGVATVQVLSWIVACRDPGRGSLVVAARAEGDSVDTQYRVGLSGIADSTALPDSLRVVSRSDALTSGGSLAYDNLRPGQYQVRLDSVAPHCTRAGPAVREVRVQPLSRDTVRFELTCRKAPPDRGGRRFTLHNAWSPQTAAPGSKVSLEVRLDLSARAGQVTSGGQAEVAYPAAVLRYDSARAGAGFDQLVASAGTPGTVSWLATAVNQPPSGNVLVGRLWFTATGAAGATAATRTNLKFVVGRDEEEIQDSVFVVEDTLTIGSGGGTNQPPVARANGPYSGTAGTALSFTAAGSADPDGSIASYAWSFGDGTGGSGATATHVYASAGTYTVRLTVTDNAGAADTDDATVTVTPGGGNQNQLPVAQANGPYGGTAGNPVTFSAAGSADPDGSIAGYAWSFGDGTSGSGASVAHAYAAPGSYTAVLTVTDNRGGADTDNAAVTISAVGGGGGPMAWTSAFGAVNPADSLVAMTITLDLSANLPETPGPEALQSFLVDSLKWDPQVLRYHSFNWGPGGAGSINFTDAVARGRLVFGGAVPPSNSTGVVQVATIRFKLIAPQGRSTTTQTVVGRLTGTPATGSFDYRPRTQVREATIGRP